MIVIGQGVVEWLGRRLGRTFHDAVGIGWKDEEGFVAAVGFDNYVKAASIHMHIYGPWLPPTLIAAAMDYPFRQLKVKRVTGIIAAKNVASQNFARKLGARFEGTMKDALPDDDLYVFGLLRKDAEKWLTSRFTRRLGEADGRSIRQRQRSTACA